MSVLTLQSASDCGYCYTDFAEDTPWVHISMASEALSASGTGSSPAGATRHAVRLLAEWVKLFADQ